MKSINCKLTLEWFNKVVVVMVNSVVDTSWDMDSSSSSLRRLAAASSSEIGQLELNEVGCRMGVYNW